MGQSPEQRKAKARRLIDDWNRQHPEGTPVRYFPASDLAGEFVYTKTRSIAHLLNGDTAVVFIEGHSSCVGLSNVSAVVES